MTYFIITFFVMLISYIGYIYWWLNTDDIYVDQTDLMLGLLFLAMMSFAWIIVIPIGLILSLAFLIAYQIKKNKKQ